MATERELGWDDSIENDGSDFITLPNGEYKFTVTGFERGRYAGGEKMGPCNKAILTVDIDGGELGSATVKENLFLHSKCEGILCSFFRSIGHRKSGEALKMDWGKVVGTTGWAKVSVRKYKKDNEELSINQVSKWLDPKPAEGFQAGTF